MGIHMKRIKYIFGWVVLLEQISLGVIWYALVTSNMVLALLLFGQYMLIMGISALSSHYKIGMLITIIGVLVFGVGIFIKFGYVFNDSIDQGKQIADLILWGVIITFTFFGVILILSPKYMQRKSQRYSLKISAEVIGYKVGYDETNKVFCPTLKYFYNNQEFEYSNSIYTNIGIPQKGSKVDIYINPNDASDAFVPTSRKMNIFIVLFGIVFIIIGISCLLLIVFKQVPWMR